MGTEMMWFGIMMWGMALFFTFCILYLVISLISGLVFRIAEWKIKRNEKEATVSISPLRRRQVVSVLPLRRKEERLGRWYLLIAIVLCGLIFASGFMPSHQVGEIHAIPKAINSLSEYVEPSLSESGIPESYYTATKDNHTKAELEEALKRINYPHSYELGVFDCSEMSSFCEHFLENEGYNTSILASETWGHAWVSVYINGKNVNIECVPPIQITNDEKYNHPEQVFKNIYEAEKAYPNEFDWWRSSPW